MPLMAIFSVIDTPFVQSDYRFGEWRMGDAGPALHQRKSPEQHKRRPISETFNEQRRELMIARAKSGLTVVVVTVNVVF